MSEHRVVEVGASDLDLRDELGEVELVVLECADGLAWPNALRAWTYSKVSSRIGAAGAMLLMALENPLGSSSQLSVGPESTTVLMTGAAIGTRATTGSNDYAEFAACAALGYLVMWAARRGNV